jgi:small subunit ribosomal protein S16
MFRVVVQDSHLTPTSGKVVAQLGHYDPHTKAVTVDKEKASFYLSNGAQPSDRVARLLQKEGVKLPDWVTLSTERSRDIRNAEKLRKNQPAEEKTEAPAEEPAVETPADEAAEAPAEEAAPAAEEATEEVAEEQAEAKEVESEEKKED